jgi:hypothetical protein
MKIIQHVLMPPTKPRQRLTPQCPVSDGFRVEFDKWLVEFFGVEPYFLIINGDTIITAPENVAMIRRMMPPNSELTRLPACGQSGEPKANES